MSDTSDKVKGKFKQAVGEATNDNQMKAKGKTQEIKGKVKDKLDDV